jgi:hypothetical protein
MRERERENAREEWTEKSSHPYSLKRKEIEWKRNRGR